jgi:hypothetical protein
MALPVTCLHNPERVKPGDHHILGSSDAHRMARELANDLRSKSRRGCSPRDDPADGGRVERSFAETPVQGRWDTEDVMLSVSLGNDDWQ